MRKKPTTCKELSVMSCALPIANMGKAYPTRGNQLNTTSLEQLIIDWHGLDKEKQRV